MLIAYSKHSSKNILLRRVEFGSNTTEKFQISNFSVVFESQIPNYTLRRRMFMINTTTSVKNLWEFEIWAKFSQILTNLWELGSNSTDFELWFRVESGVMSGRKLLVGWKIYLKSLQQRILLLLRLHRLPWALRAAHFSGSSEFRFHICSENKSCL